MRWGSLLLLMPRSILEVPQLPAALVAALLSSLASQPGDSLLSEVSSTSSPSPLQETVSKLGLRGLFRGTYSRLAQMSVIVVAQLVANDFVRSAVGLGQLGVK